MIRTVVHHPAPLLLTKSIPVERITPDFGQLIDDLAETMYAGPAVALSAVQIGEPVRLFVVDLGDASNLIVFINPEIIARVGADIGRESCLSSPRESRILRRASKVTVRATNRKGDPFELQAEGPFAVAIQHECDHLDGLSFQVHDGG